jgi:hypothetical protein
VACVLNCDSNIGAGKFLRHDACAQAEMIFIRKAITQEMQWKTLLSLSIGERIL